MRSKALAAAVVALTVPAAALTAQAQMSTPTPAPGTTVIIQPVEPPPGAPALGLPYSSSAAAGKVNTLGEGMNRVTTALSAQDFVNQAGAGGLFEVEAGRLAEDKASNPDVRAFGQRLVQDHTLANKELGTLAQAHGLSGVTMPTALRQQEIQHMQGLQGNAFDREFLAGQIRAHQETIQLFEQANAASSADLAPFKPFVAKTLPALHQHLMMAQGLYGSGTPTAAR